MTEIVKTSLMVACVTVAANLRLLRKWADRVGDHSDPLTAVDPPDEGFKELTVNAGGAGILGPTARRLTPNKRYRTSLARPASARWATAMPAHCPNRALEPAAGTARATPVPLASLSGPADSPRTGNSR